MFYDYKAIGNRIKAERKSLGKNQEELAEYLGAKRSTVGSWENGLTMPSFQKMIKLCEMFDCEMGYLLCEEGYEQKTRKTTDICKEIGISAEAVKILMAEKKRLDRINERNCEEFQKFQVKMEHKSHSLMFEVLERFIKNDKYIQTEIEEFLTLKWNIKELENDKDFKEIERAFNDAVKREIPFEYSDGGFFEEAERKELFLKTLHENALEYYKSDGYKKDIAEQLLKRVREGDMFFGKSLPSGEMEIKEVTEKDIEQIINISPDGLADEYSARHYQAYEVLTKRAEIEKEELAIALKFQKIVNDVIAEIIS